MCGMHYFAVTQLGLLVTSRSKINDIPTEAMLSGTTTTAQLWRA